MSRWTQKILLASAMVGCLAATSVSAEMVLKRGNGAEPQSLDPQISEGVPASHIQRDLFEGLVAEDPNAKVVPGVAESWELAEDGLSYTFKLRSNAVWTNGESVTANDFVYAYRRAVDPATGSAYSFLLFSIKNAEAIAGGEMKPETLGVTAIDDTTLKIDLAGPTPYFLQLLTHSIAMPSPQATIEKHGVMWTLPENIVSNGPFKMEAWIPQGSITLVKNDTYWDASTVALDKVVFLPTEDQSAELKAFQVGEIDFTYEVPKDQMNFLREKFSEELKVLPYLGTYYYGLNTTKPPFDNIDMRRAFDLALNRSTVTDRVTNAGEIPAFSFVPEGVDGYEPVYLDFKEKDYKERIAEAVVLYEKAGYGKGKPLEVEILYNTSDNHKRIALAVAGTWQRVFPDLKVKLVNQEWKVYLTTRRAKQDTQAFRAGWIGDYNDANTFIELWQSKSGLNDTGYSSEVFDGALKAAGQEADPEKRKELLQMAERDLLDSHSVIPIYYYVTTHLINPKVKGLPGNVMDHSRDKYVTIEQ